MRVLETERLFLRRFVAADADFVLRLVNEPSWLRYIGDRGVRTLDMAKAYIDEKLAGLYRAHGFGLLCVEPKHGPGPLGMCGLVRRDSLDAADLGFAFLSEHCGRGYAREAAAAVIEWAHAAYGLHTLVAITAMDNHRADRLLAALGFRFERTLQLPDFNEQRLYRRTHPCAVPANG